MTASIRQKFLALADRMRSLPAATQLSGAAGFDIRPNAVTRRLRTWASGRLGDPMPATSGVDYTDADIPLAPTPKVRALSAREIASSGGRYEDGNLVVGPITPAYTVTACCTSATETSGGYTVEQLDPVITTDGVELIYLVDGPNAGEYYLHEVRRDRSMRYELVIGRTRRTP